MSGIEDFIKRKTEFKESYEGLRNEPNLISFDGPDGSGKTEISERVIAKLKEKLEQEGKNPDDVVYIKYVKLAGTENLTRSIKECENENGVWDIDKIDRIIKLWAAKLNRSYSEHVTPLIKDGKIVILDRSEIDLFRASIEWGNRELLNLIIKYMQDGTLTHGVGVGNRIFVSGSAEDTYKKLTGKNEKLSSNDPRTMEEMTARIKAEKEAEKLIGSMAKTNVIQIENAFVENAEEREGQLEKIAEEIISKLQLQ